MDTIIDCPNLKALVLVARTRSAIYQLPVVIQFGSPPNSSLCVLMARCTKIFGCIEKNGWMKIAELYCGVTGVHTVGCIMALNFPVDLGETLSHYLFLGIYYKVDQPQANRSSDNLPTWRARSYFGTAEPNLAVQNFKKFEVNQYILPKLRDERFKVL